MKSIHSTLSFEFRMRVKDKRNDPWWETHERFCEDAESEAKKLIEFYNTTLRPGEVERELLSVEAFDK